jgi:hypothetical protein
LHGKASFRRWRRRAKTVRGAIVLVVVVCLGFWPGTAMVMTFVMRGSPQTVRYARPPTPYLSLILPALFLQTVMGKGSLGRGFLSFVLQMILLVPLLGSPRAWPPPRRSRAACRSRRRSSLPCFFC